MDIFGVGTHKYPLSSNAGMKQDPDKSIFKVESSLASSEWW